MVPGRTWDAKVAGYQKPNSGALESGREPVSGDASMPHDSGISVRGQGAGLDRAPSALTRPMGYAINRSEFFSSMIFLRVPVRGAGALDRKILFL